eukprot:Partr_v1_DN27918_c0_g1_i2_m11380 putative mRNA CAPPING
MDTAADHSNFDVCIFGKAPTDRLLETVADFLYPHIAAADVEIEAKFGTLIDKHTGARINFPVGNECVLVGDDTSTAAPWFRFQSDMTMQQHAHFNKLLNARVQESVEGPVSPVYYKHVREVDQFFVSPTSTSSSASTAAPPPRIRVTRDQATDRVLSIVRKERVAHLHIFMPHLPLDCRISISIEHRLHEIPAVDPISTRVKDRLTYRHQDLVRIDLTQVQTNTLGGGGSTNSTSSTHELELEILGTRTFAKEAELAAHGQPNIYLQLVQIFLNNIRAVAARALATL